MSKIKTPEEFYMDIYPYLEANFDFAQAYHEYASKLEMEEKIKDIESIKSKTGWSKHWGLDKAIEILKK